MINKFYNNHKETIANFSWRVLQTFWKQWVVFLVFFLCAKLLTPYDFGIYNYLLAIIFFLIIFSDFGISQSASKYVAEYNTIDKDKLKYILFNSLIVILGLGSLVSIIFLIVAYFWFYKYFIYLIYLLPLIFLAPLTSLYDGIYRWLKQFKKLSVITTVVWVLSIVYIYFLVSIYGLVGALIAQSLFYLVLLVGLALWYREFKVWLDKDLIKKVFSYWVVIWIWSIWYFLYSRVDIIILWQFWYIEEIAYYEIIDKIFMILIIPFTILAQVIAPNITALYSKWEIWKIKDKLKKFSILLFGTWIIISIILYFLFPIILKIFLFEYYNEIMILCFTILLFLLPTKIIWIFQNQAFITSTWYAGIIAKTAIFFGLLNLILNLILINIYWFIWVFIATLIVHTLNIITQIFLFNNLLNKHEKN